MTSPSSILVPFTSQPSFSSLSSSLSSGVVGGAAVVALGAMVTLTSGLTDDVIVTVAGVVIPSQSYSSQHCPGCLGRGLQSPSGAWQTLSAQIASPSKQLQNKQGLSSGTCSPSAYMVPLISHPDGYSLVTSGASVVGALTAGVVTPGVDVAGEEASVVSVFSVDVDASVPIVDGPVVAGLVSAVSNVEVTSGPIVDVTVVPSDVSSVTAGVLVGAFLASAPSVGSVDETVVGTSVSFVTPGDVVSADVVASEVVVLVADVASVVSAVSTGVEISVTFVDGIVVASSIVVGAEGVVA